jgi:hypothetical protein
MLCVCRCYSYRLAIQYVAIVQPMGQVSWVGTYCLKFNDLGG